MDPLIIPETLIQTSLLPHVVLESKDPHQPIVVKTLPEPWQLLGVGNYAGVFVHPDYPEQVVKIYAPGRPGWADEVLVYETLGEHPAFSRCYFAQSPFLVLKRLRGVTLYNCLSQGLLIPKQVILDIDRALGYAQQRGLYPHDVHGKNVMMSNGRGLVVDISDFLHTDPCPLWSHLRWGYYWIYRPFIAAFRFKIPYKFLDAFRAFYRKVKPFLIH